MLGRTLKRHRFWTRRGGYLIEYHYLSEPIGGFVQGENLKGYVKAAVEEPDRYMTRGFGRLVLGSIRKLRVEGASEQVKFVRALRKDLDLQKRARALLRRYTGDSKQSWRLIWLIYLMEDFDESADLKQLLGQISKDDQLPHVVRLWAKKVLRGKAEGIQGYGTYDKNYLEVGRKLYES